ncbi:MAG: hypothetical protein EZS28_044290, partial [Streblomastix strix]
NQVHRYKSSPMRTHEGKIIKGEKVQLTPREQENLSFKEKEIQRIISYISLQDKGQKIKMKYDEIRTMPLAKLKQIYDMEMFKAIDLHIEKCLSEVEIVLISIIEIVVERGLRQQDENEFFGDILISELMDKIESLIKERVDSEDRMRGYESFSSIVEQLIHIFFILNQKKYVIDDMINICIKVMNKNIPVILDKLKNIQIEKQQGKRDEEKRIVVEVSLKRLVQTIQELGYFYLAFEQNAIGICGNIEIMMLNTVTSIIHTNCPSDFNCPQRTEILQSQQIEQMKNVAFETIADIAINNIDFRNFLIKNHNIIKHLIHFIITYTSSNSLQKLQTMLINIKFPQHPILLHL